VLKCEFRFSKNPTPNQFLSHSGLQYDLRTKTKLNSVALVGERTMPTEKPPLVGEVVSTFANRGCCVVSATDSQGR
jgi:hypothetical protein